MNFGTNRFRHNIIAVVFVRENGGDVMFNKNSSMDAFIHFIQILMYDVCVFTYTVEYGAKMLHLMTSRNIPSSATANPFCWYEGTQQQEPDVWLSETWFLYHYRARRIDFASEMLAHAATEKLFIKNINTSIRPNKKWWIFKWICSRLISLPFNLWLHVFWMRNEENEIPTNNLFWPIHMYVSHLIECRYWAWSR